MTVNENPHAAAHYVNELINGAWATQVINAAVSLGLPEQLAQGPKPADQIAAAVKAHAPSLFRLLRAMETLGLVETREDGAFALTEAGQLLRADAPQSVRGRALFAGDLLWKQFEDLTHSVRTGERARTIGHEGFAEFPNNPARLESFQRAMVETSVRAAHAAVKVYDFGRFARVLDLGGGYGGVLAVLLETYSHMTGAVCDLGYLAERATTYLREAGVGARANFIGGDFFQSVPAGFDLYLMKFIIHDWSDERALTILRHTRAAASASAKLVLLEQVVPERLSRDPADQAIARADLTMLTVGGKERTESQYRALFAATGWRLTSVTPASDTIAVIEAVPV
jgi:orsellinic acid C2-O-methyltransferase